MLMRLRWNYLNLNQNLFLDSVSDKHLKSKFYCHVSFPILLWTRIRIQVYAPVCPSVILMAMTSQSVTMNMTINIIFNFKYFILIMITLSVSLINALSIINTFLLKNVPEKCSRVSKRTAPDGYLI